MVIPFEDYSYDMSKVNINDYLTVSAPVEEVSDIYEDLPELETVTVKSQ